MIQGCPDCLDHPYQDATYGKKMRVMNNCNLPGDAAGKQTGARCTVCGKVAKAAHVTIPDKPEKKEKKK